MTNSINVPIFNDEQYQQLGKLYKNSGKDTAYNLGLEFVSSRRQFILSTVKKLKERNLVVYCARGGMRSKGFQVLLEEAEIRSVRIKNGYKSIRKQNLDSLGIEREIIIVAGGTGTEKTKILKIMRRDGHSVIDLEALAKHRGSAFGDIGTGPQATQQQFENDLAHEWSTSTDSDVVFIESESRKIGKVVIPEQLWVQMQGAHYIKIEMPIQRRIKNLIDEYGQYPVSEYKKRIDLITRKLGGQQATIAKQLLDDGDLDGFCRLLLEKYYDKMYQSAYNRRESKKDTLCIRDESHSMIIEKIINLI